MKGNNIMKVAVAVALLFAVNMEADAQFGKLKNLAKKAKEAVVDNSGSGNSVTDVIDTATDDGNTGPGVTSDDMARKPGETDEEYRLRTRRIWNKDNPAKLEEFDVEEAGGLQQYLGLTEGDGLLLWRYYDDRNRGLDTPELRSAPDIMWDRIIYLLRINKNAYFDSYEGQKNYWAKNPMEVSKWIGYIDANGKLAGRTMEAIADTRPGGRFPGTAFKKKEYEQAIVRFTEKALKEFESKYGKIEPMP